MEPRREYWLAVNSEGNPAWKLGQSLLFRGINAQRQILQESADGITGERAREALPLARDLLRETIEGLRRLEGAGPVDHADGWAASGLPDLDQIDWPRLLGNSMEIDNPLVRQAIEDFRSAVHSPLISSAEPIGEICSRLDRLYRDVGILIEAQPDEHSAVTILRILRIVARLAIAVAVGLLATAASTVTAGGDVASSLLPAAVAAVVTALCDRLGKAIVTAMQVPPVGELLKIDRDDLVSMLHELAAFTDPQWRTTRNRALDVKVIGEITAVAEVTAQHAQILAMKVNWTLADFYTARLRSIRELLSPAGTIVDAGDHTLTDLAPKLRGVAAELAGINIPDGLKESATASRPASILSPAGPDTASAPPGAVRTSIAFNCAPGETKRQTLPTRTGLHGDDSTSPTVRTPRSAPLADSADQGQAAAESLEGTRALDGNSEISAPNAAAVDMPSQTGPSTLG